MSLPGDRLTILTPQGPASVERTPSGIRVQTQGDLTPNNARQLADHLRVMSQGPGLSSQQSSQFQGSSQQFQGGGGQGGGGWGPQGPQRQY